MDLIYPDDMWKQPHLLLISLLAFVPAQAQELTDSTSIEITRSWHQEPGGWTYPVSIRVPEGPVPQGGFPVCILLHGNGGNGPGMLNGFAGALQCHALVAPSGYEASWNICGENSDAPDVEMIGELVDTLQVFTNVNPNMIRVLGFSNGSALANRVLIENDDPGIEAIAAVVSQLTEGQFHEDTFHGPGGETDPDLPLCGYDQPATVTTGRRYLGISNQDDPVIPYFGGESIVGISFVDAWSAAWEIARTQGYAGPPLGGTGQQIGNTNVYVYAYLEGDVTLLRGYAGHGINDTQRDYLVEFLRDCEPVECDGDIIGDGEVNVDDLLAVISGWGSPWGIDDLLLVIAGWGPCS